MQTETEEQGSAVWRSRSGRPLVVRVETGNRGHVCVPADDLIELLSWAILGYSAHVLRACPSDERGYVMEVWARCFAQLDYEEMTEQLARQQEITDQWVRGDGK